MELRIAPPPVFLPLLLMGILHFLCNLLIKNNTTPRAQHNFGDFPSPWELGLQNILRQRRHIIWPLQAHVNTIFRNYSFDYNCNIFFSNRFSCWTLRTKTGVRHGLPLHFELHNQLRLHNGLNRRWWITKEISNSIHLSFQLLVTLIRILNQWVKYGIYLLIKRINHTMVTFIHLLSHRHHKFRSKCWHCLGTKSHR